MTVIQPENMAAPSVPLSPGFRAGDFVFTSGQVPARPDGSIACGNFEEEVNLALDNVAAVLQAAGASFANVVKVNAYLSNTALFPQFNEIYAQRFDGPAFPARTTTVLDFGHPDVRVEIEVVAYLGN